MSRDRRRHKGRSESGSFLALPHRVLESLNFRALSAAAVKLLLQLGAQFRGSNNGDLSAAWRIVKPLGATSRGSVSRGLRELLRYGMIQQTRQGGRNRCSLFALTWLPIDECNGKLDVPTTRVASGLWQRSPVDLCEPAKSKNCDTVLRPIVPRTGANEGEETAKPARIDTVLGPFRAKNAVSVTPYWGTFLDIPREGAFPVAVAADNDALVHRFCYFEVKLCESAAA